MLYYSQLDHWLFLIKCAFHIELNSLRSIWSAHTADHTCGVESGHRYKAICTQIGHKIILSVGGHGIPKKVHVHLTARSDVACDAHWMASTEPLYKAVAYYRVYLTICSSRIKISGTATQSVLLVQLRVDLIADRCSSGRLRHLIGIGSKLLCWVVS